MSLFFVMFTIQTFLGGIDNLLHHEITERLPAKKSAATELSLHAVRELLYAFIFFALAWYEWRGAWALLIAAVLLIEVGVTLADFVVEDRTRHLPPFERVLHTILAMNYGVVLTVLAPILYAWWQLPARIAEVEYGAVSWMFTIFAVGVFLWSVRNTIAVIGHRRPAEWVRNPLVRGENASPRRVLISGATGFIGGHVVRRLIARGDSVTVLTRDQDVALNRFGPHVRIVTHLDQIAADARIDAIINLAGAPILGMPWTKGRRRVLMESRLNTTRALVALCARMERPPRIFVSASAIGYYGVREDERIDEQGEPQAIFQSELCQQWEEAAMGAQSLGARVVRLRTGLVLGRDGGALPSLAMPVRLGFGAIIGSGRQWMSWIHIEDLVRLVEFALDTPSLRGAVNAVSPNPATHLLFQKTLAGALRRPMWMRIPAFLLRAGLGEMAQLLVDGQRVVPARALAAGFTFRHPDLRTALDKLVGKGASAAQTELTEVYFNAECPVCNAEMTHYSRICSTGSQKSPQFIDANRTPAGLASCGLRQEHLEERVYVRDSQGRVTSGMPAIIQLWSGMRGYRWLAKIVDVPVLREVLGTLYDLVISPTLAAWARSRVRSGA